MSQPTVVSVEQMVIPTYPVQEAETLPMFTENRNHQGTTGRPYPALPVLTASYDGRRDQTYEVVRLENDYLRLILIPALGGRIFEAYDKVNHYDFLYRQHVIKPALIGAYGLWISGGLEFNWPFHHRPSTFMPVNFTTETEADGTAIVWLSECDPTDRTRCTMGIVLHPDASFFETRTRVTNRTPIRHSFLMWQNAAVPVNDDYQFIFPPDVNYVTNHHHANRAPLTYPMAQGDYVGAYYDEPTDISWYKNNAYATSHFAAPSKYDFFGGYDHGKKAGVIHIANHHVSPGKKMFTWGLSKLAKSWEQALTDTDGPYCELMAGSYSNNQPDFTWLNPYETKCFSEFWYPLGPLGKASFATLEAAVHVDLAGGTLRVQTTAVQHDLRVTLRCGERCLLDSKVQTQPGVPQTLTFPAADGLYTVDVLDAQGRSLLHYAQEILDEANVPTPVELVPHPDTLKTVQELYLHGVHLMQYRHPTVQPETYLEEALRRDPAHYPSMIALAECRYRAGFFEEAKALLEKAVAVEHTFNLHYADTEAQYLLGLTLDALGMEDAAYDTFYDAAWSGLRVPMAMSKLAALDGRRKDYTAMLDHSVTAMEAAARHPLALTYAALAAERLGRHAEALAYLETALRYDPLNDLAACVRCLLCEENLAALLSTRRSDLSQTALDVAFDLADAGFDAEALQVLATVDAPSTPMVRYTAAWLHHRLGHQEEAAALCRQAQGQRVTAFFPYRLKELDVLRWAAAASDDATARNLLACELYDKGHWAQAAALWEEACRLAPQEAQYKRNLAVALLSHLHQPQRALRLLKEALALDSEHQQYIIEYLYAAAKANAPVEERLQVIAQYPVQGRQRDDYVLEVAKVYCLAGDYAQAKALMQSHRFMPAEGGELAINRVHLHIRQHEVRAALAAGNAAEAHILAQHPEALPENLHSGFWKQSEMVPLRYYDAVALAQMGRTEEAAEQYRLVLQRFSAKLPDMAFYYAQAMKALGKEIEARTYLSRIVESLDFRDAHPAYGWEDMISEFNSYMNDPQAQRDGMTCYWRAMVQRCAGNTAAARTLLEKSLRLWPENIAAAQELEFLA